MVEYQRKHKTDKPVIAICYDFDRTLSPNEMQAQGYIQSIGYDVKQFWARTNVMAQTNEMDCNLAYMLMMIDGAKSKFRLNRETLQEYGSRVEMYPGVENWFTEINQFAERHGVIVEHYILSSGIKEMIEGTAIAKEFEKIYACSFLYNEDGEAIWPAQCVNYTNKTQFLFRISKGVLDVNDPAVNDYFPPDKLRIPFRNIIYIGDSATDIPCMKLVNTYGGYSIGVYDPYKGNANKVYRLMNENRIKYYAPADYSNDKELSLLVQNIILKTKVNEQLEYRYYQYKAKASQEGSL